ncbi:hypothetical protein TIFTF001_050116 [Ficus carica]|uniref:RNase H type-1 domain-containing protein n=1 Tax=Ficus carica TaxID=3494 RepID=A0AA87YR46_FICCA|nr:hypothetical protein TIFTF001_050116 [Ficus carica]
MPEGGEHLKVADLMVEGCWVWNKGKIDDTLWPVDQELIRGIPLGNGEGGDKWVWHFDSKGLYKMWSLPPSKVWLFVWRAFHEVISTMASLGYRGIDCDVVCPRCKDKMESISHAILDCPTSQAVWKFSRFWKVLAWKLWCERNKVVHGGEESDPEDILDLGIASFGEWQALHQVPIQSQVVGSDVWLPPQSGYLKLNVDASVSPESDHIGKGAVIRDEKGRMLGAMAKSVEGTFSSFLAECIALREGLMMAKELESVTLVVETDAINVVSAVSDNTEFSLEGPILEDVKQLLVQLWNPGVYHIRRNANHVTHLLARFGFKSNCTNVWICETPIIVSNVVSFDAIT